MASSSPSGLGTPLRLAPEHHQLFDFAFEHFSGGKWQRSHHKKMKQQEQRAKVGSKQLSSSPRNGGSLPVGDDEPVLGLSALTNLLLGMGCLIGSTDELIVAVDALPSSRNSGSQPSPGSSPHHQTNTTAVPRSQTQHPADEIFLSYDSTLELVASLPSVLPRWIRCSPQSQSPRVETPSTSHQHTPPADADESFNANLPQIMEAIRLFVMFQKGHVLSLQALRTVMGTMGDEPLTQGELDYLLRPFSTSSKQGITLLQFLQLFKLL